jgi:hypothetical protein
MTVSERVAEQFLEVRDTGEANMFNAPKVQRIAYERDLHALVTWIEDHDAGAVGSLVMGNATVGTGDGDPVPLSEFADDRASA